MYILLGIYQEYNNQQLKFTTRKNIQTAHVAKLKPTIKDFVIKFKINSSVQEQLAIKHDNSSPNARI